MEEMKEMSKTGEVWRIKSNRLKAKSHLNCFLLFRTFEVFFLSFFPYLSPKNRPPLPLYLVKEKLKSKIQNCH